MRIFVITIKDDGFCIWNKQQDTREEEYYYFKKKKELINKLNKLMK